MQASPSLLTFFETDGFEKFHDVGIEIGTTKSFEEFCIYYEFICNAVIYLFVFSQELLIGTQEAWPNADLAYG
jgi:hypothetical protein